MTFEDHERRGRRRRIVFGAAYLVFLSGPIVAEITSHRPRTAVAAVLAVLAVFVALDLWYWATMAFERTLPPRTLVVVAALCAISVGLTLHDAGWAWCFVYCGVAAGASTWDRRRASLLVLAVLGQVLVLAAVDHAMLDFLPSLALIVLMGGFGMLGTGRLIETNVELRRAREEVGRLAVAEERLRFGRDLHDLLGHSLSVIVLKSELAARLSGAAPERAADEIRDVERVAREALREVREAVAGYRQLGLGQELERVRATMSAAGIEVSVQSLAGALPAPVDSTLAWALREGVTNVLRHSRAQRHTRVSVITAQPVVDAQTITSAVS